MQQQRRRLESLHQRQPAVQHQQHGGGINFGERHQHQQPSLVPAHPHFQQQQCRCAACETASSTPAFFVDSSASAQRLSDSGHCASASVSMFGVGDRSASIWQQRQFRFQHSSSMSALAAPAQQHAFSINNECAVHVSTASGNQRRPRSIINSFSANNACTPTATIPLRASPAATTS